MRQITVMLTTVLSLSTMFTLAAAPIPAHAQTAAEGRSPQPARVIQRTMLRSEPRTAARAFRPLKVDEEVMLRERRAGWSRVSTKDATGWVTSASLGSIRQRQAAKGQAVELAAPVVPAQQVEARRVRSDEAPVARDVVMPQGTAAAVELSDRPASRPLTIGGRVWLESGSTPVGLVFERRVGAPIRAVGNAWVGLAAGADYLSGSESDFKYTFLLGSLLANVHATIPGAPRLDPFVGVGAMYGYARVSGDLDLGDGTRERISAGVGSGVIMVGNIGARIYLTKQVAAHGSYTFGTQLNGQLSVGMTWRP